MDQKKGVRRKGGAKKGDPKKAKKPLKSEARREPGDPLGSVPRKPDCARVCHIAAWNYLHYERGPRGERDEYKFRIWELDPLPEAERRKRAQTVPSKRGARKPKDRPHIGAPTDADIFGLTRIAFDQIRVTPGTLIVEWYQDGKPVAPTTIRDATRSGIPNLDADGRIRITTSKDDPDKARKELEREFKKTDKAFQDKRVGYRFRPRSGKKESEVTVRVIWKPAAFPHCECLVEEKVWIRWVKPVKMPSYAKPKKRPGTGPFRYDPDGQRSHSVEEKPEKKPGQTEKRSTATRYVVEPMSLIWPIPHGSRPREQRRNCCPGLESVVQFTRACYDGGKDARFQRGREWSVDVYEKHRQRSRDGKKFNPFFDQGGTTKRKWLSPGGGTPVQPWLDQHDAPGLTEVRYYQLLTAGRRVKFTQEFIAFLVCRYARGVSPKNPNKNWQKAAIHMRYVPVMAVAHYRITWTFTGDGSQPRVRVTGPKFLLGLGCRLKLGKFLKSGQYGLEEAFTDPPPSHTRPLGESDWKKLKADMSAAITKPKRP